MKNIGFALILTIVFSCHETDKGHNFYRLWYDEPANEWVEALPIGNGRLGAMIYGHPASELIQFNEETLWAGQPHGYSHQGAHRYLDTLRQLLWGGKQKEAEELANREFMSVPFRQLCYLPFGNINLLFPGHKNVSNYKRELNLDEAVSTVSYEAGGGRFKREVFASFPDQAIIIHLESEKEGGLGFSASLTTPHHKSYITVRNSTLILKGTASNYSSPADRWGNPFPESKITFEARLAILENNGDISSTDTSLIIRGASEVTLVLSGATSFVNYANISGDPSKRNEEYLSHLEGKSYNKIKESHITDYRSYYKRLEIDFGGSDISSRPTDERLNTFYRDEDPDLVALLYQYGRYLLISSSRPGTQPANLQGIWNDQLSPPWDSKYTININAEMNYWPAEITNLSDCAEPLLALVEDLSVTGAKVAKEHYNLDGWVAHHNTDIWRGAAPINNSNHGIWVSGGAWLCQHLWQHYQFSGDKKYLKECAYPILKEASRFFTGYLAPHPEHPEWLISGPSNSPEQGGLVMGPTMDHQIIRNLFSNTIEAADILGIDNDFAEGLKNIREKIAPNQIGHHGQLQEWLDDVDNPNNKHRHVSHLWGLHPGNEIHPATTPELAEACKVTLSHRGDGGTGWSRAWKINFWARLLDGDHSFLLLKNLMVPAGNGGGLYPNLFDAHPPFQIDGNFGAVSGITEMVLQSHLKDGNGNYILDILPALPSSLTKGKINGLCARGGFEIEIEWEEGALKELKVLSKLGNSCTIRYNGRQIQLDTDKGETYCFNPDLK